MRYILAIAILLAGCAKEPQSATPSAPYTGPPLIMSGWTPPPPARPAYQPTIICSHVGNFTICN